MKPARKEVTTAEKKNDICLSCYHLVNVSPTLSVHTWLDASTTQSLQQTESRKINALTAEMKIQGITTRKKNLNF